MRAPRCDLFRMSESSDNVSVDELGQAAYTGKLDTVADALTTNRHLANVADTVGRALV